MGINYRLQSYARILNEENLELDWKVTGIDFSKKVQGDENFSSEVQLRNTGPSLDSRLNANVTVAGDEFEWHSEIKKVRPRKYEGKFSLEW